MIKKVLKKLTSSLGNEPIIFPSMDRIPPKKLIKAEVIIVKDSEDVVSIRPKLSDTPLLFINIMALLGENRRSFIKRMKVMAKQFDMEIYGIDKNWLIVTSYEVDR